MNGDVPAYGLWGLVVINTAIFAFFAFSFFKPRTQRDWRSFGAFTAFLVALFTEMYGFPLTIYLLSGWLQSTYPGVDWLTHDAGHLLEMMSGWEAHPHLGPFHLLSMVFIAAGFRLLAAAWRVLYAARTDDCATTGADLLLRDGPEAFSVFGVDTLYRVAERDPSPFFERAAADFATWPPALQRQALLVVRHLTTVVGDADLSWVVGSLSSPDPSVRSAAWRALGAYGWNRAVRDTVDLAAIAADPTPPVRASAYRALGTWGDAEAIAAIEAAGTADPDARARVTAAETLVSQRTSAEAVDPNDPPRADLGTDRTASANGRSVDETAAFDVAWAWAVEHARFDRLARDISRDRDRLHDEVRG